MKILDNKLRLQTEEDTCSLHSPKRFNPSALPLFSNPNNDDFQRGTSLLTCMYYLHHLESKETEWKMS